MANASDAWDAVVAKISRDGENSLSPSARTFYMVNRFLVDLDMGGFSGFLYNISPSSGAWQELRALAEAVASAGAPEVAAALHAAARLLEAGSATEGTWEAALQPIASQVQALEDRVCEGSDELWGWLDDLADDVVTSCQ